MNDTDQQIDPGILEMFGATTTADSTEQPTEPEQPKASEQPEPNAPEAQPQEQPSVPQDAKDSDSQEGDKPAKSTTSNALTQDELTDLEDKISSAGTKQNKAFAELRMRNKSQNEFIMRMAKAAGLNPQNAEEAQQLLAENLTTFQAKKQNVDPDVLRKLEEERTELEELRALANRQAAMLGFQKVKDEYHLTNEDLNEFAGQLAAQKINPFGGDTVDLLKEYRMLNFEKLLAQAREEGRQEEISRSAKAKQNSTTPSKTSGKDAAYNETPVINSVKDLDKYFESINKK